MVNRGNVSRFPTIQATMGDWHYYITTLPFSEVEKRVKFARELITPSNLNELIQRDITPGREEQIADYLIYQEQHFFPSIVVGVHQGEPKWYEIEVESNSIFGTPGLDPRFRYSLGILELDGTENLYAIDGQHRVAGIKEALRQRLSRGEYEEHDRLANECICMIFVSADDRQEGHRERIRRLFTTLNRQARSVSEPEVIALDEDDAAAIITRRMVNSYVGFRQRRLDEQNGLPGLIQMGTRHEIQQSNDHSITTIVSLYRMVKVIFRSELKDITSEYRTYRPSEKDLKSLYEKFVMVWEYLREYDSALRDVLYSDPEERLARKYRNRGGGHLLFRPLGLQAFSGALQVLRTRNVETERAIKSLCELPMLISDSPWRDVVWNPNTRRIISVNKAMTEALLLHMLGQRPRSSSYDLESKYNQLHGATESNPFSEIPTYSIS